MATRKNKLQEANEGRLYRLDPITGKSSEAAMTIEIDGLDLFVKLDGIAVAKRGQPGSSEAGRWISLKPGISVRDITDTELELEFEGARLQ
jgi:hypothetical protein